MTSPIVLCQTEADGGFFALAPGSCCGTAEGEPPEEAIGNPVLPVARNGRRGGEEQMEAGTETLDPLAILAALGLGSGWRAAPVSGGADAAIWRVERGAEALALRVLRPEQAAMARREAAAMRAMAEAGVPVPRVRAAGSWQGRPALALDWCPGRPLADEVRAWPWRAWALGRGLGRVQAAIHATPPPAGLEHPVPWFEWGEPDGELRMRLLVAPHRPAALLHLDYHPLNVLVAEGEVAAVLDWANARVGDPRADLARTLSILRLAPLPRGPAAPAAVAALRAIEAGWRRGYREAAGRIGGQELAPFCAWAGAVMLRDLAPRLGRADLPWLTDAHLDRVRRWTARWRARAGLDGESC